MAQRRLAKDEEEEKGNREEEQAGADREERRKDADYQAGHRQQEGRDGGNVHELVLQVMARKDLTDPMLEPSLAASRPRVGRRAGGSRPFIGLRPAAEPAKAGILLDLLAALTTEHARSPFRRTAAAVFAANYTGAPGAQLPKSTPAVTKCAPAPLQASERSKGNGAMRGIKFSV